MSAEAVGFLVMETERGREEEEEEGREGEARRGEAGRGEAGRGGAGREEMRGDKRETGGQERGRKGGNGFQATGFFLSPNPLSEFTS